MGPRRSAWKVTLGNDSAEIPLGNSRKEDLRVWKRQSVKRCPQTHLRTPRSHSTFLPEWRRIHSGSPGHKRDLSAAPSPFAAPPLRDHSSRG